MIHFFLPRNAPSVLYSVARFSLAFWFSPALYMGGPAANRFKRRLLKLWVHSFHERAAALRTDDFLTAFGCHVRTHTKKVSQLVWGVFAGLFFFFLFSRPGRIAMRHAIVTVSSYIFFHISLPRLLGKKSNRAVKSWESATSRKELRFQSTWKHSLRRILLISRKSAMMANIQTKSHLHYCPPTPRRNTPTIYSSWVCSPEQLWSDCRVDDKNHSRVPLEIEHFHNVRFFHLLLELPI